MTHYVRKQDSIFRVSHNIMLKMIEELNAFLEHDWIDEIHVFKYFYNYMHVIFWSPGLEVVVIYVMLYSRVTFATVLLPPLSSRTKHSRLMVHHNSSILSVLSVFLTLFWCACVLSFSILMQFY
jgi:hypothetical protein